MHAVDLILCLLVVLVVLVTIAQRLSISYPIILVIGGLILSLFPRLPEVRLEPDIVFLVFLPPLLYWDAINSSWRDLRENWRPISLLAIGLVFATTMVIMVIAHALLGFPWGPAFVLGAVLGPTDTVAVAAILERFSLPRRWLAVLRGESLLNDATALVLYETAVHTTQVRNFVWGSVSIGFCLAAASGIAIGLAVGWLMLQIRRFATDPLVANTIALLTGFAAYLPAYSLHVSGVLAVVSAGLYLSWEDPRLLSARTRLQSIAAWEVITFLLNGLLFILIGLQLRMIVKSLSAESLRSIISGCLLVSGTVILVRILWVFISMYVPPALGGRLRARGPYPEWQQPALFSWVGIRGGISLAAALAIPISLADGSPFPRRNEILILTFAVILATLVLQGLSLPSLLRWLNLGDAGPERAEERTARQALIGASLQYLAAAAKGDDIHQRAVNQLQKAYRNRAEQLEIARRVCQDDLEEPYMRRLVSLQRKLIGVRRTTLIDLRDRGAIGDDVLRRLLVSLDLEESQLEAEEDH